MSTPAERYAAARERAAQPAAWASFQEGYDFPLDDFQVRACRALQQGKGRADGRYTQRRLTLLCAAGRFDVSDDAFEAQPLSRDGKGQAAVLAARDCPASADRLRAGGT